MLLVFRAVTLFLSTPSARRATCGRKQSRRQPMEFLSTPSARRATCTATGTRRRSAISIHALREEGDRDGLDKAHSLAQFLSTPSARRATPPPHDQLGRAAISIHALREEGDRTRTASGGVQGISIHALREEGDSRGPEISLPMTDFYPRPPRGGRRDLQKAIDMSFKFLSTPSARRATFVLSLPF